MKKLFYVLVVLVGSAVFGAENVKNAAETAETPAVDFNRTKFVVPWNMTPAECQKAGFTPDRKEDDEDHFCLGCGDMQYYFQRKDNRLAYCRIFNGKLRRNTIAVIVNRNVALLSKEGRGGDVDWNDLPRIRKGEDELDCTYVIRHPDATMLFVYGARGAFLVCEMRIFNPEIYPPIIKSITKKYASMLED